MTKELPDSQRSTLIKVWLGEQLGCYEDPSKLPQDLYQIALNTGDTTPEFILKGLYLENDHHFGKVPDRMLDLISLIHEVKERSRERVEYDPHSFQEDTIKVLKARASYLEKVLEERVGYKL